MKKKRRIIVISMISATLLSITFLLMGAAPQAKSPSKLATEYSSLKAEMANLSEQEITKAYADIFDNIAKGSNSKKAEYAGLLRSITNCDFSDDEVFEVARNFSDALEYDDFGIRGIRVSNSGRLIVDYLDIGAYRVRNVQSNEKMYMGERLVDVDDGTMGTYYMLLELYEVSKNEEFFEQYSLWDVHQITGTNLKIKITPNNSHGYNIYIGSNEPLNIAEVDFTNLRAKPLGSIEL